MHMGISHGNIMEYIYIYIHIICNVICLSTGCTSLAIAQTKNHLSSAPCGNFGIVPVTSQRGGHDSARHIRYYRAKACLKKTGHLKLVKQ